MSSILTNASAMVALETLRGINKSMGQVQAEISTGKRVSSAKDNAAVFAIATVMSSDVASFDKISDSLNLGSATVGVARAASEQVTDLIKDMRSLIISSQEDNVDRTKNQTDIAALRNQIDSIVNAAQFNGLNLLKGGGSVDILSSLDRASDGTVSASNINVSRISLETSAELAGTSAVVAGTGLQVATGGGTIATTATETVTLTAGAIVEGYTLTIALEGIDVTYVAKANETLNDVAVKMQALIEADQALTVGAWVVDITNVSDPSASDTVLSITNTTAGGLTMTSSSFDGGTIGGGLAGLTSIDVSTDAGAAAALTGIDNLLTTAIDAATAFGSAQKRIDIQGEFVHSLMDSMKVGIGALVDADMEEASARLQSLQVQQQLGVQALSMANQAPQALLALFQ
ncbi:MAG: flagellin [Robiginitomaculum sp.]|nr:MAG: flagellin [Robiginitomaculum sp.]